MFCPKCGNSLPDGSSFCGQCGTKLERPTAAPAAPAAPKIGGAAVKAAKPLPIKPIAVVVAVVLVLAVVFGLMNCSGGRGFNNTNDLTKSLTQTTQKYLDSKHTQSDFKNLATDLEKFLPEGVFDLAVSFYGDNKDEALLDIARTFDMPEPDNTYWKEDVTKCTITWKTEDQVSSTSLNLVNGLLAAVGSKVNISNAYELMFDYSITEKDGYINSGSEYAGYAVLIDGKWYMLPSLTNLL